MANFGILYVIKSYKWQETDKQSEITYSNNVLAMSQKFEVIKNGQNRPQIANFGLFCQFLCHQS